MSIKVMIIDGVADFRSLLMHHVTTHWPDAIISAYDPTSAGHLPDEFSGAGNDIVLLGENQGERNPLLTLRQFVATPGFPAVIYFGNDNKAQALEAGASAYFQIDNIRHNAFIVRMGDLLRNRHGVSSTDSLFVGDMATGIHPLIKGYRFVRRLAASEHSAVYLARKESTDVEMVLKVLRQVPDLSDGLGAFDRFLQEYEMIAEIDHPNIVRIFDLGVSDDHAHIAMEYVPGGDLKQRISHGILEKDALAYTRQIAGALSQLHSRGILHRDLKPGNIMVRADDTLALIDFGLAKRMRLEQEITGNGEIFGTPYYMSPEQGHAEDVDERSDIYGLGVIYYEMLTGQKPYLGNDAMTIIMKHAKAPVPVLPHRLGKHQALINLLLAKRPEDRLQSADEVLAWE
ncbi:MAG: serine/threonine protein kinase [Woeseiaceae bacterium]